MMGAPPSALSIGKKLGFGRYRQATPLPLNLSTRGRLPRCASGCPATRRLEMTRLSPVIGVRPPKRSTLRYTTGNVSLVDFTRVMGRAVVMQSAKKIGLLAEPPVAGSGPSSVRTPTIGLQPGDWVRVKKREDIEATLNDKGKNRGLWFDREMLPFCGQVLQVRQRITRLIDDSTGKMIELTSDCVTLDGAVCSGQNSLGRWFCSRAIYPYWREGWLERVNSPSAMIDGSEPS
jgi:hypothetical protein